MASAQFQFSEWLRRYHPGVFADAKKRAKEKAGSRMSGLGQRHPAMEQAIWQDAGIMPNFVPNAPNYSDMNNADKNANKNGNDNGGWLDFLSDAAKEVTSAAKELGPLYFQSKMQKELLDINVDRAKKGLPPLTQADMPKPSVRVETDVGEQVEEFKTGVSNTMQKALLFGGLGLGAYFLFFQGKK